MRASTLPAVLVALSCGCYYGSMQGARTLGEERASFRGGVMMPAYFSSADRLEAEESGDDFMDPYPGFSFSVGATEEIDLGLAAMGYGIGPFIKYGLLDPGSERALSVLAGINYVMPPQVVSPRASIQGGILLGSDLEVYGGWEAGYGPDLADIPDDEYGERDWDAVENTFFHAIKAGCIYTIKDEESEGDYGMFVPELIGFEFSVPLDLETGMIVAGLSAGY